jgi:hypothetical protein
MKNQIIRNRLFAPKFSGTHDLGLLITHYEKKEVLLSESGTDKEIGISTACAVAKYLLIWVRLLGVGILDPKQKGALKSYLRSAVLNVKKERLSDTQVNRVCKIIHELQGFYFIWPGSFKRNIYKAANQKSIIDMARKIQVNQKRIENIQ